MKRFTDAVALSLVDKNWYAALFLSLSLPDICARLQSDNGKTNGPKYAAWFDKYLAQTYTVDGRLFISGNDLYALRCAMLHQGMGSLVGQQARDVLARCHFSTTGSHRNRINDVLQLNVQKFCGEICEAVRQWEVEFRDQELEKVARLTELLEIHSGPHQVMPGVWDETGRAT